MKNIIIVASTLVIILAMTVMSLNTIEIISEQRDIKVLPDNYNPYQKLYDELLSPTVRIESPSGVGSGVITNLECIDHVNAAPITTSGHSIFILTASHIVGNQNVVTVTIYTPLTPLNRGDFNASVVITDTVKDLALLRVLGGTAERSGVPTFVGAVNTAKLAPRDYNYYLFTPVYTIGCSLGLDPRPSSGIISAITLPDIRRGVSAVEVTSPILPGNSGGPVYDANTHEIIGIAVWVKVYHGQIVTTMAGIVPINQIYEFLDKANLSVGCISLPEVSPRNACAWGRVNRSTDEATNNSPDTLCRDLKASKSLRIQLALRKGGEEKC
jgi:S1-C subfamily serine protease